MIFRLHPRPPYDFALTAAASPYYTTLHHLRDGALWRVLRHGTTCLIVRVRGVGSADAPLLEAEVVYSDGVVDAARLAAQLRHWLSLDADLAPFYASAVADPVLADTTRRLYGLHILRTDSVFEALMVTIIEQQIALRAAQKAERWLVETYGDTMMVDGIAYQEFPTAQRLAILTTDDLIPLKITFIRMNRMLAIARQIANGQLDLEALHGQPYEAQYHTLLALNGIGHWTAAWTMVRAFGAYVYCGSADVALRAAVNHYWRGEQGRAERSDTDALFARYGAMAGYASVYTLMRWGMERYPLEKLSPT